MNFPTKYQTDGRFDGNANMISDYCGHMRMQSNQDEQRVVGIAYNSFLNEDLSDCYFDYERPVLLNLRQKRYSEPESQTRVSH